MWWKTFILNAIINILTGQIGKELGDVVIKVVQVVATKAIYRDDPDKNARAWEELKEESKEAGDLVLNQLANSSTSAVNFLMEALVYKMKNLS